MDYLSVALLSEQQSEALKAQLSTPDLPWKDGRLTAGRHAVESKQNAQLDPTSSMTERLTRLVQERLLGHELIKSYGLIRRVHSVLVSRFRNGDHYGWHVDNPFSKYGRRDLSFTLFLSHEDEYTGGSLVLQALHDQSEIRLPAGHVVIYPSTALHCVTPVTSGERFACVGWIESYVQSSDDRALLFNLESAAKGLLARHGRSEELDLVFQVYANALRRLAR